MLTSDRIHLLSVDFAVIHALQFEHPLSTGLVAMVSSTSCALWRGMDALLQISPDGSLQSVVKVKSLGLEPACCITSVD